MRSKGLYRWLGPDERRVIAARLVAGASLQGLAAHFGCSTRTIARVRDEALMLRLRAGHSPRRLSVEERERIFEGVVRGESDAVIARAIGRHRSTVGLGSGEQVVVDGAQRLTDGAKVAVAGPDGTAPEAVPLRERSPPGTAQRGRPRSNS